MIEDMMIYFLGNTICKFFLFLSVALCFLLICKRIFIWFGGDIND